MNSIECPNCKGTTIEPGGCFPFDPCAQCTVHGVVCDSCLANPCECNNFNAFIEKHGLGPEDIGNKYDWLPSDVHF